MDNKSNPEESNKEPTMTAIPSKQLKAQNDDKRLQNKVENNDKQQPDEKQQHETIEIQLASCSSDEISIKQQQSPESNDKQQQQQQQSDSKQNYQQQIPPQQPAPYTQPQQMYYDPMAAFLFYMLMLIKSSMLQIKDRRWNLCYQTTHLCSQIQMPSH